VRPKIASGGAVEIVAKREIFGELADSVITISSKR
jgi:hypothetical protein